jgi:hypothetical protein
MNRFALLIATMLTACATQAQTPVVTPTPSGPQPQSTNPLIGEMKRYYTQYKGFWTRAAAAMPEDGYSFKPAAPAIPGSQEMRTFGALLAHVADHQTQFCSTAMGTAKRGDAAGKTTKADLMAALAASYAECDAAWDSLTDANAGQMMGQRSKLGTLIVDLAHSEEEYGYMAVYFRLKGIIPPSSDRSGGR